jgi:hypothetical protein
MRRLLRPETILKSIRSLLLAYIVHLAGIYTHPPESVNPFPGLNQTNKSKGPYSFDAIRIRTFDVVGTGNNAQFTLLATKSIIIL